MITINELKGIAYFSEMTDDMLKTVSEITELKKYQKGEYLKKEGMESKNLFIVKSGKIAFETELYGEKTARLGLALEGDSFGETSIIPPHKTTTSRVAIENSVLVVVDGVRLRDLCESDHQLGYFIMKNVANMLSRQIHRTREQLIHSHWG